ncbi:MAG: hypothetical protein WCL32_07110 [Planctomycetota bacterium]
MSVPHATRPKDGASLRSTRQLLDELDVLMDQMLAIPVVDDPEPPPRTPALAATLTLIEPDDIAEPEVVTALPAEPAPLPIREIPITRLHLPVETPPAEDPEIDSAIEVSPEALLPETPVVTLAPREPRPLPPSPASWSFRSAIVWDRGFRRMTRRLWLPGRLMRSLFGRTALGLLGLSFLVAAAGWLLKDWTQWPR